MWAVFPEDWAVDIKAAPPPRTHVLRSWAKAKGVLPNLDKERRVCVFNSMQRKPYGTRTFDVPYTVIKAKPSGQVDGTNDITSNDVSTSPAATGCNPAQGGGASSTGSTQPA